MKKLKVYKNGDAYIENEFLSIYPAGVEPEEEYDITEMKAEDIQKLKENPKDKALLKKDKKV